MNDHVQILVIGGGPAGSTAAALLAKAGMQVRLLERDTFPRYHIGESLLASCLPTLRLSGAFDKVKEHGFQIKRGGVFHWKHDKWHLDWSKLVDSDAWSWQVDRASYDDILLRNAATQGAEVIEGATVKNVEFHGDRPVSASWVSDGTVHHTEFDFLVDASGRAGSHRATHHRSPPKGHRWSLHRNEFPFTGLRCRICLAGGGTGGHGAESAIEILHRRLLEADPDRREALIGTYRRRVSNAQVSAERLSIDKLATPAETHSVISDTIQTLLRARRPCFRHDNLLQYGHRNLRSFA